MQSKKISLFIGVFIILFGLLLLFDNVGVIYLAGSFWWGLIFFALGMIFLNVHKQQERKKGPLVVGIAFIILGIWMVIESFVYIPDDILGSLFLWVVGLIFISIYIRYNQRWWAVLPGGLFLVGGFVVFLDAFSLIDNDFLGFIFMMGISLVFWYLYLIRDEQNKLAWAGIVGLILSILSFFILSQESDSKIADMLFPLVIIISGAGLIIRGTKKSDEKKE